MNATIDSSAMLNECGFSSTIINGKEQLFNNGHIGIINDLVFGLCYWTGSCFASIDSLDLEEVIEIQLYIEMGNHPFPWQDKLNALIDAKRKKS